MKLRYKLAIAFIGTPVALFCGLAVYAIGYQMLYPRLTPEEQKAFIRKYGSQSGEEIADMIRARLRDAPSARLSPVKFYRQEPDTEIYCGSVNAKNAFGGYTGWEPYYVMIKDGYQPQVNLSGPGFTARCPESP